ncbi:MAG: ABC transporter substrate-binding protein [Armatimonadota bacterium]|nr:ABC transporter substrate-binding protein [Armatimonadota bacterium]MDR7421651.1 ABC transporter substrate-binding protein [Armatimonadota bacterium]MDR7455178.1 ABC transporter substrate-binding protein [Armatimonadota bacterium]MDR7455898.1 ABC transporter substrate-binding protein [Armatimonadota bacterium]MDR7497939.1 ABC transporter substrate-binding protein [Armatimonadota bacterium]
MRRHLLAGVVLLSVALAILAPAGAQDRTLSFALDTEAFRRPEAEAIAEGLRGLGVQTEVRVWERTSLIARIQAGERQAYLTDWGSAYFDPFDLAEPKFTTGGRGNYSFYSNREVDSLLVEGVTGTDAARRREAYFKVQEILFREAPWIFGYFRQDIHGASTLVENWEPSMDSRINLHDVRMARGGLVVVGMNTNAIVTFDPAMFRDRKTETVLRNIFDGLVTRTTRDRVVLELASAMRQPSPTLYEFTVREGVTFHNGDPLTVDDVVFTFERILRERGVGGESSPRRALLGPLQRVERVDDRTVRFVLERPFPVFLQALVHFQIVPRRYIQTVGDRAFAERPVGAGPFRYVTGRVDSQIVLERYDQYYGGAPDLPPVGPAPLRGAVFRMMPEPATRVAALKAGEVHIIEDLPVDLIPEIERDPRTTLKTTQGTRVYGVELNNRRPPFNDAKVRQALNYAVNWEAILRSVYRGTATRLSTAFLPSGFGYNPRQQAYPYDLARARTLLREAGYTVR